jgi:hypothetical protein
VISRSFQVLFSHVALFLGVTLASLAAIVALSVLIGVFLGDRPISAFVSYMSATSIGMVTQGLVDYAVFQVLTGRPAYVGKSASYALARVGQLVVISIASSIGIGLGMLLLVIPGLVLICVWAVVVPACVVEGLGVMDAFSRSASLTKGHRLQVLGIFILSGVVVTAFIIAAGILGGLIFGANTTLITILLCFIILFPMAFFNVMGAVMYFRLRVASEGVTIESLSGVFD